MWGQDWDDYRFLLAVAREKTLTAAAATLGVDQTTVSRRLRSMQDRSSGALFEQLRGGVVFTALGEAMVQAAGEMEKTLFDLERLAIGQETELSGSLRITAPELLAYALFDNLWTFAREHPRIDLQIQASNSIFSLARRETDLALRFIANPEEYLFGRRISQLGFAIYGAPCFEEVPLDEVPWVGWDPLEIEVSMAERFRQRVGGGDYVLWTNTYLLLVEALRRGVGATVLPCVVGDREPTLERLTKPEISDEHLWVLTHQDMRGNARVRALMEHVSTSLTATRKALLGQV